MRYARGGHKDVLCRVRHTVENTTRKANRSIFEGGKCSQPRLEPSRKIACRCRKPRMLCSMKPRPIAKPQGHYVCGFRLSNGRPSLQLFGSKSKGPQKLQACFAARKLEFCFRRKVVGEAICLPEDNLRRKLPVFKSNDQTARLRPQAPLPLPISSSVPSLHSNPGWS